jgi:hypothetical protein
MADDKEISTTQNINQREYIRITRAAYGFGWDVMLSVATSEEEAMTKRKDFFRSISLLEEINYEMQTAFGDQGGYSGSRNASPPKSRNR